MLSVAGLVSNCTVNMHDYFIMRYSNDPVEALKILVLENQKMLLCKEWQWYLSLKLKKSSKNIIVLGTQC